LPACAPALTRAEGRLLLSFRNDAGTTRIARLEQAGCLRARLPRPERGAFAGAVTLNTAGGIASGDTLATHVEWQANARATVCAAAAERVYRARAADVPARVETTLWAGPGAVAEWLPQETILFDGARLDRRLRIELAGTATLLLVEAVVFGRAASGEQVKEGWLNDLVELRRDGVLIHADRLRLEGPIASILARPAIAAGAGAVASLLWTGPDPAAMRDALRAAFAGVAAAGAEAGASLREGVVLARIVARDGAALRRMVVAGLSVLRQDRPLPRVWQC
jgi:urease accessory protein